ncbi:hypothetical protein IJ670_08900 [bacterium]|nr:hypothetical protein [bacterium]
MTDDLYKNIINTLKDNSIEDFEKIFAMLEIEKINSKEDFKIFASHLINHSNPVREAFMMKLEDIIQENYIDDEILDILTSTLCDINPNVARQMCLILEKHPKIAQNLEPNIISKTFYLLEELEQEKTKNNKSHAKNKKLFSLYWLLEGLSYCVTGKYNQKIRKILKNSIDFECYTIREKIAKIALKLKPESEDIIEILKNDNNFYVNFCVNSCI